MPPVTNKYLEFGFSHSLEQIITSTTKTTKRQATLIDHALTISSHKVSHSRVIDLGLSDDLIFCTRKTLKPESHKHNEILVRSLKYCTIENLNGTLKRIHFPDYLKYTCVNAAYSDFTINFM